MTGSDHRADSTLYSSRHAERLRAHGKIKLHSAQSDGEGGGGSARSEPAAQVRIVGSRATVATPKAGLEREERFRSRFLRVLAAGALSVLALYILMTWYSMSLLTSVSIQVESMDVDLSRSLGAVGTLKAVFTSSSSRHVIFVSRAACTLHLYRYDNSDHGGDGDGGGMSYSHSGPSTWATEELSIQEITHLTHRRVGQSTHLLDLYPGANPVDIKMALADYDPAFIANASSLDVHVDWAATVHLRMWNMLPLIPVGITKRLSHSIALQDFRDMALWNMLRMGLEEAPSLSGEKLFKLMASRSWQWRLPTEPLQRLLSLDPRTRVTVSLPDKLAYRIRCRVADTFATSQVLHLFLQSPIVLSPGAENDEDGDAIDVDAVLDAAEFEGLASFRSWSAFDDAEVRKVVENIIATLRTQKRDSENKRSRLDIHSSLRTLFSAILKQGAANASLAGISLNIDAVDAGETLISSALGNHHHLRIASGAPPSFGSARSSLRSHQQMMGHIGLQINNRDRARLVLVHKYSGKKPYRLSVETIDSNGDSAIQAEADVAINGSSVDLTAHIWRHVDIVATVNLQKQSGLTIQSAESLLKLVVESNQSRAEYTLDSLPDPDVNIARGIKWKALELSKLKRSKVHRMMMIRTFHHSDPVVIKLASTKKTGAQDAEGMSVSMAVDTFANGGSLAAIVESGTEGVASLFADFGSDSNLSEAVSNMGLSAWSLAMSLPMKKKDSQDGQKLQGCQDCPKPAPLLSMPPRSIRDLYPKTSWERNNADGTRGEEYTTKPSKVSGHVYMSANIAHLISQIGRLLLLPQPLLGWGRDGPSASVWTNLAFSVLSAPDSLLADANLTSSLAIGDLKHCHIGRIRVETQSSAGDSHSSDSITPSESRAIFLSDAMINSECHSVLELHEEFERTVVHGSSPSSEIHGPHFNIRDADRILHLRANYQANWNGEKDRDDIRLTSQTCTGHKSLQKQCNQWAGRASLDLPDQNDKRHTTTLLVVATLHDVNNRTNVISFEGETILQVTKSSFVLEQMLSCQGAGRVIIDPNSLLEFSAAFGTANAIVEISEAATIKFPHFHHFLIESEASITVTAPDIVSYPSPSGSAMITGLVTNNDIVIFNRVLQDDQHLFEMKMSAGGEYKVGSDQFGEPHFMIASTYDLADILPDEYNEAFGVDAHLALEGNVIRLEVDSKTFDAQGIETDQWRAASRVLVPPPGPVPTALATELELELDFLPAKYSATGQALPSQASKSQLAPLEDDSMIYAEAEEEAFDDLPLVTSKAGQLRQSDPLTNDEALATPEPGSSEQAFSANPGRRSRDSRLLNVLFFIVLAGVLLGFAGLIMQWREGHCRQHLRPTRHAAPPPSCAKPSEQAARGPLKPLLTRSASLKYDEDDQKPRAFRRRRYQGTGTDSPIPLIDRAHPFR